jgi:hypothetical protein
MILLTDVAAKVSKFENAVTLFVNSREGVESYSAADGEVVVPI